MADDKARDARGRFVAGRAADASRRGEIRRGSDGRAKLVAAKEDGFSPERQDAFFAALGATANVSAACRATPVSSATVWEWRQRNAAFAARWQGVIAQAYADLELAVLGQALFGITSEVTTLPVAVPPDAAMDADDADTPAEVTPGTRRTARRDAGLMALQTLKYHQVTALAAKFADDGVRGPRDAEENAALVARVRDAIAAVQSMTDDAVSGLISDDDRIEHKGLALGRGASRRAGRDQRRLRTGLVLALWVAARAGVAQ